MLFNVQFPKYCTQPPIHGHSGTDVFMKVSCACFRLVCSHQQKRKCLALGMQGSGNEWRPCSSPSGKVSCLWCNIHDCGVCHLDCTYMHTYIHTYIYTHIYTYIQIYTRFYIIVTHLINDVVYQEGSMHLINNMHLTERIIMRPCLNFDPCG